MDRRPRQQRRGVSYYTGFVRDYASRIGNTVSAKMMDSTRAISDKISDSAMNATGECTLPQGTDAEVDRDVVMKKGQADLIRNLRVKAPKEYRRIAAFASELEGIPREDITRESVAFFRKHYRLGRT